MRLTLVFKPDGSVICAKETDGVSSTCDLGKVDRRETALEMFTTALVIDPARVAPAIDGGSDLYLVLEEEEINRVTQTVESLLDHSPTRIQ